MRTRFLMALSVIAVSLPVGGTPTLRVALDFFVNPNHVPLIVAEEAGLFADAGIEVDVFVPASPSDPVKLAASRAADLALTPQINYLIARSEGLPLTAVGALIDGSLGGLLALRGRGIDVIADLRGGRIGYALAPLEPALWRAMLRCAGVDEREVELIHVGFNTMQALLAGSVDAIGAFRNYEPVVAELEGRDPVFFPQEAYCVPSTLELIWVAHPSVVDRQSEELAAFLDAVAQGIARTIADPVGALELFVSAYPELDDELNRRGFERSLPLYAEGVRHDDPAIWLAMQAFLVEQGLIDEPLSVEEMYTGVLLPPVDNDDV